MIGEVRDAAAAAGRTDTIDVQYSYPDRSIASPTIEPDRHREALAEIEKAGVTAVVLSSPTATPAATLEFLEAFGETYYLA